MSGAEFTALLSGIGADTALGRIVSVRAEKDKERIKEFTPSEMKIYTEWRKKTADQVDIKDRDAALESIKNAFIEMAKG